MPLTLTFELTDRDLEHFNQALAAARAQAGQKNADEIITAASRLLGGAYGDSSGYARRGYTSSYRPGMMRVR